MGKGPRGGYADLVQGVRAFFGVFRYSARAVGLVWSTHRALALLLGVLSVAAGLLPGAVAYVGKLIIDAWTDGWFARSAVCPRP